MHYGYKVKQNRCLRMELEMTRYCWRAHLSYLRHLVSRQSLRVDSFAGALARSLVPAREEAIEVAKDSNETKAFVDAAKRLQVSPSAPLTYL